MSEREMIEILRKNLAHYYKDVTDYGDFYEIAKEIIKRKAWDGESPIMDVVKNSAYFMARQLAQKH
jgi:hypothetical protein